MAVFQHDYLVVGGGVATDEAVRAIRELDAGGTIGILSADAYPPYDRPPLSKGLWSGAVRMDALFHNGDYEAIGVDLRLTTDVCAVRPADHVVVSAGGVEWRYGKLLLATGCAPRQLAPSVAPVGTAMPYRTLSDYARLRRGIDNGARRILVVGGGFIGAELAAALAGQHGVRATLLVREPSLWSGRLPHGLSAFLTAYYREHGVEVIAGDDLAALARRDDGRLEARTGSGRVLTADRVVAGIGVLPRTGLAEAAGISVSDGVVVDGSCATSAPDIFCAGDAASFPSALGGRTRVEHEDLAHTQGRLAGRNMAGAGEPYEHIPMFYSDLFDLGFEAVGQLDSGLTLVEDWMETNRQGVVYYLDERSRLVGVLLWNVWERIDAARDLLRERASWPNPQALAGRIRP